LGGLEEDARLPTFESNEEEFFFNREQVQFQSYVCFLSLKIHVARIFLKYNHVEFTFLIEQHLPFFPFSRDSHI